LPQETLASIHAQKDAAFSRRAARRLRCDASWFRVLRLFATFPKEEAEKDARCHA
jgi:hypothetical protein